MKKVAMPRFGPGRTTNPLAGAPADALLRRLTDMLTHGLPEDRDTCEQLWNELKGRPAELRTLHGTVSAAGAGYPERDLKLSLLAALLQKKPLQWPKAS